MQKIHLCFCEITLFIEMIFFILGLSLIVYSLVNFKKSFLVFLFFKLFLNSNIALLSSPNLPLLSLDMFLSIWYVVLFFFLYFKKETHKKHYFPFKKPFILLTSSYFLSSLFSLAGIGAEVSSFIGLVFSDLLIVYLIWKVHLTKRDFFFVYKGITIVVFLSCLYAFYEVTTKSNPLIEYEISLIDDPSKIIDFRYTNDPRGYRVQSIFEHAIGAGMIWGMYLISVLVLIIKFNKKPHHLIFEIITAVLCIPCILLTRSRSPVVFTALLSLATLGLRGRKAKAFSSCYLIIVPIVCLIFIIFSLQNSIYQSGSSLQMRIDQFYNCFQLLKINPIFGLGTKFQNVLTNNPYVKNLLGMESIWLQVLTQYGLLGMFSYLYLIYAGLQIAYKNRSYMMAVFWLSYWIVNSITSIPGFQSHLLYFSIFSMLSCDQEKLLDKKRLIVLKTYCLQQSTKKQNNQ